MRTLSIRRPQPHTANPWKEEKEKIEGDKKKEQIRSTGKHWLSSENPPVPHHQIQGDQDRSKETLRGAQRFYGTEKLYSRKRKRAARAAMSSYVLLVLLRATRAAMSSQSSTSNALRDIREMECTAQRMHWVTIKLK